VPLSEVPAAAPFPVDVFPPALAEFVQEAALSLACPADFVGLPMLVLAGAAIGASRALEVKPGWWERPALYAAVIGRPGTAKSPALKLVAAPFYARQQRLKERYDQELAHYEKARDEHEVLGRKKKDVLDIYAPGPPKPEPPLLVRTYCSDATVESLAPLLRDNPRGLAVIRDELSALVTGLNQYKSGRGSDRQFYLAAWAGEPVAVDRRQQPGGPLLVPHPFLAVVGGVPPDVLAWFKGRRGVADGFLDRFLFAYPEPGRLGAYSKVALPEPVSAAWRDAIERLSALDMEADPEGGRRPRRVRLTDSGRRAWEAFAERLADEMNALGFPDHLIGPWSKLKGYGARLALILQLVRHAAGATPTEDVDGESVCRAEQLVAYFQSHARKAYAAMEYDATVAAARHILQWLEGHPEVTTFSRAGLHQGVRRYHAFAQARALDQPLAILVRHGYLRQLSPAEWAGYGRKPTDRFEVNPLWRHPGNPFNPVNPTPNSERGG
jgi:hypothetical protein